MKRDYGVICLIYVNGKMNINCVAVVAENPKEAEEYAIATVRASGYYDVTVPPDLPGAKSIQDNGPASIEQITNFELFCRKNGIRIK